MELAEDYGGPSLSFLQKLPEQKAKRFAGPDSLYDKTNTPAELGPGAYDTWGVDMGDLRRAKEANHLTSKRFEGPAETDLGPGIYDTSRNDLANTKGSFGGGIVKASGSRFTGVGSMYSRGANSCSESARDNQAAYRDAMSCTKGGRLPKSTASRFDGTGSIYNSVNTRTAGPGDVKLPGGMGHKAARGMPKQTSSRFDGPNSIYNKKAADTVSSAGVTSTFKTGTGYFGGGRREDHGSYIRKGFTDNCSLYNPNHAVTSHGTMRSRQMRVRSQSRSRINMAQATGLSSDSNTRGMKGSRSTPALRSYNPSLKPVAA